MSFIWKQGEEYPEPMDGTGLRHPDTLTGVAKRCYGTAIKLLDEDSALTPQQVFNRASARMPCCSISGEDLYKIALMVIDQWLIRRSLIR